MTQPAWLRRAWADLGIRERAGSQAQAAILAYYRDVGHSGVRHDEVAWCAAFLGAHLERSGISSTRALLARSYADWGAPLDAFRLGAIAVLSRGADPGAGHVGFLVGETDRHLVLLGGNQADAVTVAPFERSRLLHLRWPSNAALAAERPLAPTAAISDTIFEAALAHVLQMEGGWSEDAHDPGGPTQRGITLATYAAWKGRVLDSGSFSELRAALRAIPQNEVHAIYMERYWRPCQAAALPPALAIMHFDAAVNHGVGTAARMLQEALGVAIDGEIGPLTRAVAQTLPTLHHVEAYAEIRRKRYRALQHFWRFGRGWLRRVDATVAAARSITADISAPTLPKSTTPYPLPPQQKGHDAMSNQPKAAQDPTGKWWGESMTVWGALVTAVSTVLPVLGPLLGLNVTTELVQVLGQQVTLLLQAAGGLAGTLMTIYGRSRASVPLMRRDVSIRL